MQGEPSAPLTGARYEAAAALISARVGVDIAKLPGAYVGLLLDALPALFTEHDADALSRVISTCSVGETMFMRHPEQFAALEQAVPTLKARDQGRPLFVWSAGCATGEEAYSLAAVLSGYETGVRVLGTDVNPASIQRARTGRYRLWSMRGANPLTVASWLSLSALEATVQRDVLDLVSLSVQNLVEDSYPTGVDVIFCRNVLLYFCADTAEVVISRFHESLRPGGLLFLGYCDPRPPEGGPWSEERSGSVCYFRKGCHAEERRAPAPEVTARCASSEAQPAPTAAPKEEDPRPRLDDIMSIARGLCGQGASLEALRLLAVVRQESPFEVGPNVLAAMIAEEAGLFEEALDAARRAHFLAPDEPICQYLFGVCLDRLGETRRTELCLAQARSALDRMVDLRLLLPYGEGLTGAQLRRMIDARLNDSP